MPPNRPPPGRRTRGSSPQPTSVVFVTPVPPAPSKLLMASRPRDDPAAARRSTSTDSPQPADRVAGARPTRQAQRTGTHVLRSQPATGCQGCQEAAQKARWLRGARSARTCSRRSAGAATSRRLACAYPNQPHTTGGQAKAAQPIVTLRLAATRPGVPPYADSAESRSGLAPFAATGPVPPGDDRPVSLSRLSCAYSQGSTKPGLREQPMPVSGRPGREATTSGTLDGRVVAARVTRPGFRLGNSGCSPRVRCGLLGCRRGTGLGAQRTGRTGRTRSPKFLPIRRQLPSAA